MSKTKAQPFSVIFDFLQVNLKPNSSN